VCRADAQLRKVAQDNKGEAQLGVWASLIASKWVKVRVKGVDPGMMGAHVDAC
jgi:hypothetical protein